jgi:hypothetical protein
MLTAESMNAGTSGEPVSGDAWLSAVWFFLPHMDLRLDGIYSAVGEPGAAGAPSTHTSVTTWLAQYHVFL